MFDLVLENVFIRNIFKKSLKIENKKLTFSAFLNEMEMIDENFHFLIFFSSFCVNSLISTPHPTILTRKISCNLAIKLTLQIKITNRNFGVCIIYITSKFYV